MEHTVAQQLISAQRKDAAAKYGRARKARACRPNFAAAVVATDVKFVG